MLKNRTQLKEVRRISQQKWKKRAMPNKLKKMANRLAKTTKWRATVRKRLRMRLMTEKPKRNRKATKRLSWSKILKKVANMMSKSSMRMVRLKIKKKRSSIRMVRLKL